MWLVLPVLSLLATLTLASSQELAKPSAPAPNYTIEAIRYANVRAFPLSSLDMGAPPKKRIDIAMVFWMIRAGGRNILFDCGFHRPGWIAKFRVARLRQPAPHPAARLSAQLYIRLQPELTRPANVATMKAEVAT